MLASTAKPLHVVQTSGVWLTTEGTCQSIAHWAPSALPVDFLIKFKSLMFAYRVSSGSASQLGHAGLCSFSTTALLSVTMFGTIVPTNKSYSRLFSLWFPRVVSNSGLMIQSPRIYPYQPYSYEQENEYFHNWLQYQHQKTPSACIRNTTGFDTVTIFDLQK